MLGLDPSDLPVLLIEQRVFLWVTGETFACSPSRSGGARGTSQAEGLTHE